jgi:formylmethanofuran dehydrogenase subunit E
MTTLRFVTTPAGVRQFAATHCLVCREMVQRSKDYRPNKPVVCAKCRERESK